MDSGANTREGTTSQGQLVSLIALVVKHDLIINLSPISFVLFFFFFLLLLQVTRELG